MLTNKQKQYLEEYVYRLAKKAINEQYLNEDGASYSEKEYDENKNNGGDLSKKRKQVTAWLNNDMINDAELMRQLWNPRSQDEEDTYRSFFSKKKRGEREFTEEEINKLYKIFSQKF